MKEHISFDSHKHYTLMERQNRRTGETHQCRIDHTLGAIRRVLETFIEPATPVAIETTGKTKSKPPAASRSWSMPARRS